MVPAVFSPGIVTTEFFEFAGIFSPDMREFYLTRSGGAYAKPAFVKLYMDAGQVKETRASDHVREPFISVDGKTLYLGNRYRELTDTGWSDLKSIGAPFSEIPVMRLTVSSDGTYYFDAMSKDCGIHRSR